MVTLQTATHRPSSPGAADAAAPTLVLAFVLVRAADAPSAETLIGPAPLTEAEVRLLEERARALIEQRRNPDPDYAGGLTEREVEVLRLIAAGKRNWEIADALVISLFTVARHVSNIFDKTGTANRAEAAVFAFRHGLL